MQLKSISQCNRIAFNILDAKTKQFIMDILQNDYGLQVLNTPQNRLYKLYKHYELKNTIQKMNMPVYLKSIGNMYYLFLTKYNYTNVCFLVDTKVAENNRFPKIELLYLGFDDTLYEDTVFLGEMIKDKYNNWIYQITELYVMEGKKLVNHNFNNRLSLIYEALNDKFKPQLQDIFSIQVKKFYNLQDMKNIEMDLKELPYTCNSLAFKQIWLLDRRFTANEENNNETTDIQSNQQQLRKDIFFKFRYYQPNNNYSQQTPTSSHSQNQFKHKQLNKQFNKEYGKEQNTNSNEHFPVFNKQQTQQTKQYQQKIISNANNDHYIVERGDKPDIYSVMDINDKKFLGYAFVQTYWDTKNVQKMFENVPLSQNAIIQCKYLPDKQKYKLLKFIRPL